MCLVLAFWSAYQVESEAYQPKLRIVEELPIAALSEGDIPPLASQLQAEFLARFSPDQLNQWGVTILPDATVRLINKRGYYTRNQSLSYRMEVILKEVLVPVLRMLSQPHISRQIAEIRLESHTSSDWGDVGNENKRFELNKVLSQQRAKRVLRYMQSLPEMFPLLPWLESRVVAYGFSSSKPLMLPNGLENKKLSSRLELRVIFK